MSPRSLRFVTLALASLLVGSAGCAFMRRPKTPMEALVLRQRDPASTRGAVVLLPGFGDEPSAYAEHGFVALFDAYAPGYDVYAADAHFGYYRKHTVLERLEQDVIAKLRARGYREIWLVGASMGGFGAVGFARKYPDRVRGVLLLAPYLGPQKVLEEVDAGGGLCAYQTELGDQDDEETFARANMLWLKQQICERKQVGVWLGVGTQDRLLVPARLLTRALPKERSVEQPGGHGWDTWTPAATKLAADAFDTQNAPH